MRRHLPSLVLAATVAIPLFLFAPAAARAQQTDGQVAAPAADASAPPPATPPPVAAPAVAPPVVPDPVPPPPQLTRQDPPAERPKAPEPGRFEFGSYGRVRFASDLRGGTGREANLVAHGSRIDEESYAEIELRREDVFKDNIKTRVVATLAMFPPFFHFSGNPAQALAMRNLYAQATYDNITMWAGSRMYRGDDIYLLNWWPLDNQNTVGGGVGGKLPKAFGETSVAAHMGMQRLDNPYQFQQIAVQRPFGFGATNITKLDRPRIIETLKITHLLRNNADRHIFDDDKKGFKIIGYGELHHLSAGVTRDPVTNLDKPLPGDTGFMIGSELAYWTGERDTFVQLFLRHARGVAAYDPLAAPQTFANDKTSGSSTDTLIALGGNWESGMFAVLGGAYLRFFRDGDTSPTSIQKYDEGTVIVRPQAYFGEHWGLAVEGSYQQRRHAYLDAATDGPLTASLVRFGVMPFFSPAGRGSYKRPQFRLIYSVTGRDAGARSLYAKEDVFAQRKVEHFAGLGVEWWFNSSSYP